MLVDFISCSAKVCFAAVVNMNCEIYNSMTEDPKYASKSHFFGRSQVLDWLHDVVFSPKKLNCSPLILLYGSEGVGKTATCEHFIKHAHQVMHGVSSLVSIPSTRPLQNHSVVHFSELLLEVAKSKRTLISGEDSTLHVVVSSQVLEGVLPEVEDSVNETYDSEGTAQADISQQKYLNEVQEQQVAEHFGASLLDWFGSESDLSLFERPKNIIFIFDGFEDWQAKIKRWVGGFLYPELERLEQMPHFAYILTGMNSWQSGNQADYWKAHPGALIQCLLPPLTRHECKDWLLAEGGRPDLLDVLIEETEGVPRRVEAALRNVDLLEDKFKLKDDSSPLGHFTAQERRWLHAAAMSTAITQEALQVLLGRKEGLTALSWLGRRIDLCRTVPSGDGLSVALDASIRELVISQVSLKLPMCHQDFLNKMELLAELSGHVPSRQHRDFLSYLSPAQPLCDDLIEDVYGGDG